MDGPRAHFHHLRQPPHKERRHAPLAPQIRQETSSREEETCEIAITGSMRRGVEKKGREKVENSILQPRARVSRGEGGEERSIKKKNTSVTMITYVKVAGRHRSMLLRTCNRNRNGKLLFKKQKEEENRTRVSVTAVAFFLCLSIQEPQIHIYIYIKLQRTSGKTLREEKKGRRGEWWGEREGTIDRLLKSVWKPFAPLLFSPHHCRAEGRVGWGRGERRRSW